MCPTFNGKSNMNAKNQIFKFYLKIYMIYIYVIYITYFHQTEKSRLNYFFNSDPFH